MRKITLFLSMLIAMTTTVVAQSAVNLTFTRADQSIAVAITDENGATIEGATATVALSGSTSTWKSNGELATLTNVICPDVNANTNPTIEMAITINGFGSKKLTSLGLDIHGLNGSGNHQSNGDAEPNRHWNVDVKANDASFASYTDLEIAKNCVTDGVTHKMHNAENVTATEVTDPVTLKLTIGKGTDNGGCFFGLEKVVLGVEDVQVTPEYEASVTLNPATLPMTDVYAWATVENNVATFTAEVYNDKYEFVGWTSGTETVSTDLVYTETLTANRELVANFQEKVVAYEASVTLNPATLPMTDVYAWATVENNVATFTAEVYNDKYEFVGWTSGTETVSTDLVYTETLTANRELVANFQEKATEPSEPAVKWYRVKEVSTGEYMNVFSYDPAAEQGAYGLVNVAAYNEEGADQIFTLEAAETEGQYYLRTQNDYYVTTAAWNVNVSNAGKSAIIFEETTVDDLTTYVLRDPSKNASQNYFKIGPVDAGAASGNFVYCNAAADIKATWVLEEVVAKEPETPAEPVVLDFTTNDVWGLPLLDNVSFAGQKTVGEYNNGTYTITIDPTANAGQFYFDNNNLRLQKTGSKIVLPAFDFPVAKIEVVGLATSSYANVDMNVYVGDNAVSTACTGSTGTNVYEIAAASQAAGTIYELVIGEAGGAYSSIMNITAINIYPGEEGGDVVEPVIEVAAPVLGDENTKKYFDLYAKIPVSATFPENATETAIYYTTNGDEPTKESLKTESGSSIAVSSHVGTTIKAVAYCVVNGTEYYSEVATATYYEAVTSLYEMSGAVETGKKYMLVADLWGTEYNAMTPAESTPTKTLAGETVTVNDVFVESLDFFAFTFEAAGTNYKIKDATGMYLGFDGMTASFVLSETGVAEATSMASYDWTVTLNEDVASISIFGRTLAMSGTSWKTVTNVTMTDVLPQLYVAREYPTLNVTPNSKDKQETLKEIVISCATGLEIDEEAGEIVVRDQGTSKQVVVNPGTDDEYTDWVMEYNYFEFTAKMNDEGTAYTIALNEEITVTGDYELVVPAGYFIIEPAGYNKPCEDLYETFNVVANVPFVVDNVTPTNGSAVASLKRIEIDFSDDINELNDAFDVLDAAGNVVTTAATSYFDADGNYFKDYSMVALELATEITEAGTYTIIIPAGKFYVTASYEGYDQATGEYIYSKVSDEITLTFTVDPALGIENVEGENGETVIFDITGRKIETITAPGIYIVNGKKVLVK